MNEPYRWKILDKGYARSLTYLSRYLAVGVINTLVGYGLIFLLMYQFEYSPEISNLIGYGVGLIFSYSLNRNYTFKSKETKHKEFVRFFTGFFLSYGVSFCALVILTHPLKLSGGLGQILSGIVYVGFSFLLNRYYVFKDIDGRVA